MQGALSTYRETLAGALEIHLFNRDIDDTSQRVIEKSVAMNTSDTGKDLPAVEQLQRKQEAMERDMTAIEGKLKVGKEYASIHKLSYFPKLIIVNLFNKIKIKIIGTINKTIIIPKTCILYFIILIMLILILNTQILGA